jgi:hypothetical protein
MKFFALAKTTIGSLIVSLVLTATAYADAPSNVRLRGISYAGSGCPSGTVAQSISADHRLLNLRFDSYIAEVGRGVPVNEARRNCQVNIDLDYPSGWSFAIESVDYRGYASLERGVVAVLSSTSYYAGATQTARLQTTFRGPFDADYSVRDQLSISSQLWSPCGVKRSLNINTQVRLDNSQNRNGDGLVTVDRMQTATTHQYGLLWRRC